MIRSVVRLLLVTVLASIAWTAAVHAQKFPSRPVTLIVPFPAGGSTDVLMGSLASTTEKHLGQPIEERRAITDLGLVQN